MSGLSTLDRLIVLQNLVKRDPSSYVDEFHLQLKNFHAELDILRLGAGGGAGGNATFGQGSADGREDFKALTLFLAHVSHCFPVECAAFPGTLLSLLDTQADALDGDTRRTLVQALILVRNKGLVPPVPLLKAFFALFRVKDKLLREMLFSHIVADIKAMHAGHGHKGQGRHDKHKHKHHGAGAVAPSGGVANIAASTRAVQAHLYALVSDTAPAVAAKRSLDVLIELYRRKIWTDARTVNVMAQALSSSRPKLLVTAVKFFLGLGSGSGGEAEEGTEDSDEEGLTGPHAAAKVSVDPKAVRALEDKLQHRKKTRKHVKQLAKQLAALKKGKPKAGASGTGGAATFPAIQLLHDPQGVSEKMLAGLRKSTNSFEVRLLCLNLLTRIIGTHRLLLLPLYSFLQRYLTARQEHVTQILACLLQSVHEMVPPDEVAPIARIIANSFVNDAAGPEVLQVGLNSLRELVSRCPAVLEEEGMGDLVSDLVMYRKHTSKGVVAASRALLNLVREWFPALLRRRDRGREVALDSVKAAAKPSAFGALAIATGVEGAELLTLALARKAQRAAMAAASEQMEEDEEDEEEEDEEEEGARSAAGRSGVAASSASHVAVDPAALAGVADGDEWRRSQMVRVRELVAGGQVKKAKALLEAITATGGGGGTKPARQASTGAAGMLRASTRKVNSGAAARAQEEEEAEDLAQLLGADEDEDEDEDMEQEHGEGEEEEEGEEDEEMDEGEEEEEGEGAASVGGPTASLGGSSRAPSKLSKSSMRLALATALQPMLGAGGKAKGVAQPLEATRIMTPKDFDRIRALQGKLADKGVHLSRPGELMALLQGGEPSVAGNKRPRGSINSEKAARWEERKRRKGGRGLGLAEDEEPDVEEEEDQLAQPGVSYAPPVSTFDPLAIEALETGHKRKQADKLLDVLKAKQQGLKAKFGGKKSGGGLTNVEKRRMKVRETARTLLPSTPVPHTHLPHPLLPRRRTS